MFESSRPYTFDRVVRLVLLAATLLAVFFLVRYLADVLIPFAAAAVLAYFLNPLVTAIQMRMKTPRRRFWAVAFTLAGVFVVGFSIVVVTFLLSMHQVRQFDREWSRIRNGTVEWFHAVTQAAVPDTSTPAAGNAPIEPEEIAAATQPSEKSALGIEEFWDGWSAFVAHPDSPLRERFAMLREPVRDTAVGVLLDKSVTLIHDYDFTRLLQDLAQRVIAGGGAVLNLALETIVALSAMVIIGLYLFFLLLEYPAYRKTWHTFLPQEFREPVIGFLREFDVVLRRYFRGQFIIASILAAFYAVGFSIIGLPMAIPFGLFVGMLLMIPYLQLVAIVPAIILSVMRSLSSDASLAGTLIAVLAVFLIAQAIQDAILTPRILGKATGLSPVAVMLGLFVWGKLLGFLGLIVAIPLTCLGIAYYRRVVLRHSAADTSLLGA